MIASFVELAWEALGELRALRAAVERLADREESDSERADGPVYVTDAARILGMSRSTLDRKIAECPPEKRPAHIGGTQRRRWFWPSREAVVQWAESLHENPPQRTQRPTRRVVGGAVTDWAAVARQAGAASRKDG